MKNEVLVEMLTELFDLEEDSAELDNTILFEFSVEDLKHFASIVIDKCQEIILYDFEESKDNKEPYISIISNINDYYFDE